MYINGTLYDKLDSLTNISEEIGGNLRAAKKNPDCVEVTFKSGSGVEFCEAKGMMSFVVTLSNEFFNNTKGLLGTYNNKPDDDFTLPDGTVLGSNINSSTIHYDFGLKCEYWFFHINGRIRHLKRDNRKDGSVDLKWKHFNKNE